MKRETIHNKAIRLVEGGQVDVDGHCVKMKQATGAWRSCTQCEMDSICRFASEMSEVCNECDIISRKDCYLELVTTERNEPTPNDGWTQE